MMPNDSNRSSDTEIICQVLDGNIDLFEHMLVKYEDHVVRIVTKHVPVKDIEETAQNVFIRAYQSLRTFKKDGSFKQWLSTIAIRTCYDYWRKAYRSREVPISSITTKNREWLEEVISDESSRSFREKSSQKEAKELLNWALDRISAKDRMVLELVYLEGFSVREASELLGWSVANVKIRSFRSRKKLKKLLIDHLKEG